MELGEFSRESGEWLAGTGPESDIVISSRIRLARNLAGFRFPGKASEDEKARVVDVISAVLDDSRLGEARAGLSRVPLESMEILDRLLMVERRLISKEHAQAKGPRSVAYDALETKSVMINEEDHLRIQVLRSGLDLHAAWGEIRAMDDALAQQLTYAFSPRYGYLTSCPTNLGTGIRVSVMLHLPGIGMIDHMDRVRASGAELDLAVRGLYGEGSRSHGDFFQISNQVTLGRTEEQLIEDLLRAIARIIHYERAARRQLRSNRRDWLEDKVWRSHGTMTSARRITSDEALDCLSSVRLGVSLELIDKLPLSLVNELFLYSQPAHLQKLEGKVLDAEGRDAARARYIRSRLARN